jgi:hypothetical protein
MVLFWFASGFYLAEFGRNGPKQWVVQKLVGYMVNDEHFKEKWVEFDESENSYVPAKPIEPYMKQNYFSGMKDHRCAFSNTFDCACT